MTPRHSARQHLPALVESFDALKATFGASLEYLTTPDGTWGQDPTEGCPRLTNPQPLPEWPPKRLTR